MFPLSQFRFELRGTKSLGIKITKRLLERIARQWIRTGKSPHYCRVIPIIWSKRSPSNVRRFFSSREKVRFGCPGVVRYYGSPRTLLLDFDHIWPVTFIMISAVFRHLNLNSECIEYHRTRRGWHVAIRLKGDGLKPAEICALQVLLGSDPRRETFNLSRVLSGKAEKNHRWNLLFDYKV